MKENISARKPLIRTILLCLAWRVANALLIRTAFSPDEYWQSLEVAHRLVFGYGHLTWEWAAGIRSCLHPLIFAAPLQVAKWLGADFQAVVLRAPQLLQAAAAAATDTYVYLLAGQRFGRRAARWALVCQLASWFNAYCLVRTVSNSLEALALVAALHHLGRYRAAREAEAREGGVAARQLRFAAAAAALGVVLRPPSLLFWLLPGLLELWTAPGRRACLLRQCLLVGGGIAALSTLADRAFYGRWLFVPWEFARFNLVAGGSAQYGVHPWHWNLTQGLPTVAATLLPLGLVGMYIERRKDIELAALVGWSLAVYSLPAHKEFRFLLPALQLLVAYCGVALAALFSPADTKRLERQRTPDSEPAAAGHGSGVAQSVRQRKAGTAIEQTDSRQQRRRRQPQPGEQSQPCGLLWRVAAVAALLLQLPAAGYFGLVHQRGTIAVMSHLAAQQHSAYSITYPKRDWVLFLTPCHATPWYSHLHAALPMRFLDCSPPGWGPAVACLNPGRVSPAPGWAPAAGSGPGHGGSGSGSGVVGEHGSGGSGSRRRSDRIAAFTQPAPAALGDCHRLFDAGAAADPAFQSERQRFEAAPAAFLQRHLPHAPGSRTQRASTFGSRLPRQVVLFDNMLGRIEAWARPRGYVQTRRFAHAQLGVDGDREGAVLLLELMN